MTTQYEFLESCALNPVDYLRRHAGINAKRIALFSPGTAIDYGSLVDMVDKFSKRISAHGVARGQRVEIVFESVPMALVLSLALQNLGCATILPYTPEQAGNVPSDFRIVDNVRRQSRPTDIVCTPDWLSGNDAQPEPLTGFAAPRDLIIITTSTGTTRAPKAIDSSLGKLHASVLAALKDTDQVAGRAPCFVSASLGSLWGYRQMMSILWSGGTLAIGPVNDAVGLQFKPWRIRHLASSVGNIANWLMVARRRPGIFGGVEAVTTAGALLTPALEAEIERYICKDIYTNYGTSETGLIAVGNARLRRQFKNFVGKVVEGARVEIVDGNQHPVPAGQTGEVRIWVGEEGQSEGVPLRDGWFHPGDMGSLQDGNKLCVEGRVDDMVNIGGRKFSLDVINDLLVGYDKISDHTFFAVPDKLGVQELYCAVVPRPGFDAGYMRSILKDLPELAGVLQMERLPRTQDGKIKRRELVEFVKRDRGFV